MQGPQCGSSFSSTRTLRPWGISLPACLPPNAPPCPGTHARTQQEWRSSRAALAESSSNYLDEDEDGARGVRALGTCWHARTRMHACIQGGCEQMCSMHACNACMQTHQNPNPPKTGPKPHELYGKFTWKIGNFSEISKRELRSTTFDVGGYKW